MFVNRFKFLQQKTASTRDFLFSLIFLEVHTVTLELEIRHRLVHSL